MRRAQRQVAVEAGGFRGALGALWTVLCLALPIVCFEAGAVSALPTQAVSAKPTVTGTILLQDGSPLAGVEVTLHPTVTRFETGELLMAGRPGAPPIKSVQTGDNGRFRIQAPAVGMWRLQAHYDGYVSGQIRLTPLWQDVELRPVALFVDHGLPVSVVDSAGRAVPGATVIAYRRPPKVVGGPQPIDGDYRSPIWHMAPFLATTDESGAVSLPAAEKDQLTLVVVAEGFPQRLGTLSRSKPKKDREIFELQRAPSGWLKVTDPKGRPAPGVLVFAAGQPIPLGKTSENGMLPVSLSPDGETWLTLSSAERFWLRVPVGPLATPSPRVSDEPEVVPEVIHLELKAPVTARGRVYDDVTEEPLAGALVWSGRSYGAAGFSDRRGEFELTLEHDAGRIRAALPGYRPAAQGTHLRYMARADSTQTAAVAVPLRSIASAQGQVIDPWGEAVPGVQIALKEAQSGSAPQADEWQAETDPDGQFALDRLAAGVAYRVQLRVPPSREATSDSENESGRSTYANTWVDLPALEPGEHREGMLWTLDVGRHAEGWAVDDRDVPLVGAEVSLSRSSGYRINFPDLNRSKGPPDLFTATTDAEGRFFFTQVPAARYNLSAKASGFAPAAVPGIELPEEESRLPGTWDLGTLALVPGVSVVGRVVDAEGDGIAEAMIRSFANHPSHGLDNHLVKVPVDEEGRFEIPDLAPGQTLRLTAGADGFLRAQGVMVQAPDDSVRLVLKRGGYLEGRVLGPTGEPLQGAGVHFQPDRAVNRPFTGNSAARSKLDGSFRLGPVEAGSGKLVAKAGGYVGQELPLTIPAVGEKIPSVEIRLEAGVTLRGRAVTDEGKPVVGAYINASTRDSGMASDQQSTRTDADGRFELNGLRSGKIFVDGYYESGNSVREKVELTAAGGYVEIVFKTGYSVSGRVVDSDGKPVAGISMRVGYKESGTSLGFSQTDSEGRFRLNDVFPGEVAITASSNLGEVTEELVVTGPTEGVELVLDIADGARVVGTLEGLDLDQLAVTQVSALGPSFREGRLSFDGSFEISNLTEGTWQIIAQVEREGRMAQESVEIQAGESERRVVLEFRDGFELNGAVRLEGGPAGIAGVSLTGPGNQSRHANILHDGSFSFRDLEAGSYNLTLTGRSGGFFERTVHIDSDRDIVVEPRVARVSGTVVDPEGRPIHSPGITLQSVTNPRKVLRSSHRSGGQFFFPWVEEGEWLLIAGRSGFRETRQRLLIQAGSSAHENLELKLTRAGTFQIEAQTSDGRRLKNILYQVTDSAGDRVSGGSAHSASGVFTIDTVPDGRWWLWLGEGMGPVQSFPIEVGGQSAPLSLTLQATSMVRFKTSGAERRRFDFQILGNDGQPMKLLMSPFGGLTDQTSISQGSAIMIPAGTWNTVLIDSDGARFPLPLTVPAGQNIEMELP